MSKNQLTAYYVSSTHWDREWIESYQQFRYHLVELMDEVIELLEGKSDFPCFENDGQSILLEDYLEIRPERTQLIHEMVQDGRMRAGPWYTLPDENIPTPEALIRNLEEGIRVAKDFGNVSRVGFVCDIFGHVSQLPQILRGFDIDNAFVWRGMNEDTHGGVFCWRGADDSEVVSFCFGPGWGYGAYAHDIRRCYEVDEDYSLEAALPLLIDYVQTQDKRTGLGIALLFDGVDHMQVEPTTPQLLDRLREQYPGKIDVKHVGLTEFAEAMNEHREQITRTFQGEFRAPGKLDDACFVIPGVLSSRVSQKIANRAAEASLLRWVEPFGALASWLGGPSYPHTFLRTAWRFLLQNHAHDSICGCSPDHVHRDVDFRFEQASTIGNKLTTESLKAIANRIDTGELAKDEFSIVLFNPTQSTLEGPVDLELAFPADDKEHRYDEFFHFEPKVAFRLFDVEGNEVSYDYCGHVKQRTSFVRPWGKTPQVQTSDVVNVCVPVSIPPLGYTTLLCKLCTKPTRHPGGNLVSSDRVIENEFVRVEVCGDGSVTLLDKTTGQTYENLLVFEERADIGDGWYHGVAVNDKIISSSSCPTEVALINDGAQKATLRVTHRMQVPEEFEFGNLMQRSRHTKVMEIRTDLTVRSGKGHLEVCTCIDNNIRDHRVRVLFDTGAQTDMYQADSAFDVVERPIGLPEDNHTYKELALETAPQASWTAAFDAQRGLAVVAPYLSETAVRDLPQRPIALTLLRSFRRTAMTNGEEGGQSLGVHKFCYALVPFKGQPSRTRLAILAQTMCDGLRTIQVSSKDQAGVEVRQAPRSLSQLTFQDGNLIATSFRLRPDGENLELRVYNPGEETVEDLLTFLPKILAATMTNLEGIKIETVPVQDCHQIRLQVPAKRIVTLAVQIESFSPAKSP